MSERIYTIGRHPGRNEVKSRDRRATRPSAALRSRIGLKAVRDDDGAGMPCDGTIRRVSVLRNGGRT